MKLKLICCDVFLRIASYYVSKSPHIVDVEFIPMLAHDKPDELRLILQERINISMKTRKYDKLLLGYGLCGNTTANLYCEIPIIIPRVHDCCAMFLGSKNKFLQDFGEHLSMRWCSNGYYERGYMDENYNTNKHSGDYKTNIEYLKMVEQYGEENAEYVWETMHPKIETKEAAYIQINGFEYNDSLNNYGTKVRQDGAELKIIDGDPTYLERLINGPWDDKEFLHVSPGNKIKPVYDMDVVYVEESIP